jgi:RNA recognition motif-containing protein
MEPNKIELVPVFVHGVHLNVTEDEFSETVNKFLRKEVGSCLVIDEFTKESKGFGFIFFTSKSEADKFINNKLQPVDRYGNQWVAEISKVERSPELVRYHNEQFSIKQQTRKQVNDYE